MMMMMMMMMMMTNISADRERKPQNRKMTRQWYLVASEMVAADLYPLVCLSLRLGKTSRGVAFWLPMYRPWRGDKLNCSSLTQSNSKAPKIIVKCRYQMLLQKPTDERSLIILYASETKQMICNSTHHEGHVKFINNVFVGLKTQ